ncbi:unnamed protein product [Absidia cylindrospora]
MPKKRYSMETPSLDQVLRSSSSSSTFTLNTRNNHDNADIICCPCGDDDDGGFTIQCEQCLTWQHGECMNISPTRVPRCHICDSCQASPRQHYLRQADGKGRYIHSNQHQQQQQHSMSGDGEDNSIKLPGNQTTIVVKKKSRDISTSISTAIVDNKDSYGENGGCGDNDESNRSIKHQYNVAVEPLVKHESAPDTSHFIKHGASSSTVFSKKQLVKRKGSTGSLNNDDISTKRVKKKTTSGTNDTNNYDDDDETVTPYDYSASSSNPDISTPPKSRRNSTGRRASKSSGRFVQVSRNVIKNKLVKQTMKEACEQWKSNNDETSSVVSLNASVLLPSIPKVSVRPLWKSLLDRNTSPVSSKNDASVRKGVFAEIHVPENRFLMEINGEISIKSTYKCDLGSLYPRLHTPEDHLFFYPSLDLMIDARSYGNDSRYIRRSCYPNAQVKCITLLPHSKDDEKDDDQTVHLGLFTMEDVEKGEELSIAWDWQRGTSLWKNYTQWKRQQQQQQQQQSSPQTPAAFADPQVELMLDDFEREFGECACQDKDDCFVAYLKDMCQPASSSSAVPVNKTNKKGAQRRRRQRQDSPNSNDTPPNGAGQLRQSKDSSSQQLEQFTSLAPNQKPEILHESLKATGKTKRRRGSKNSTSVDLTMIDMNAKNDIFFASLPPSRATSPVNNTKLLQQPVGAASATEKQETGTASASASASSATATTTLTSTTVVDIVYDTVNMSKKWVASNKLPCKKAWMKTYLAEMDKTRMAPMTSPPTVRSNVMEGFWGETDSKMDHADKDNNKMVFSVANHEPGAIIETTDNNETTAMMDDLVMDESIGDDSSTATLPLDNGNDMVIMDDDHGSYPGLDRLTDKTTTPPTTTNTDTTGPAATTVPDTSSKGNHHHPTFLATEIPLPTTKSTYSVINVSHPPPIDDNHNMDVTAMTPPDPPSNPKPVKAKLSLQEYLSMRKKHH